MLDKIFSADPNSVFAFLAENPLVFFLIMAWVIFWKGLALWKASRLSHKWWFVIILIANTLGVLEIIYIYFVARKYTVEVEESIEETEKTAATDGGKEAE